MSDRRYRRVFMIGMDGLDPRVLGGLMKQKELPGFARLMDRGGFSHLATSNPAQSPVAWASIATGNNPGYHGIFDFIGRRVSDYMPELAIMRMNPKNIFGKREAMFLPVMHGKTFWDYTSEQDIPSTILKWPMTFQPKQNEARLLSGLGVPDIKGGLGKYAFYTTRSITKDEEGHEKVIKVGRNGDSIKTYISGPNIAKLMSREAAKTDLLIKLKSDSAIELHIDGRQIMMEKRKWSEWVDVKFKLGMMKTASSIVKFYLNSITPDFEMYMTAVQINPRDPAFIISSPDDYVKDLHKELGCFYTLGMPEDTKAIEEGRIDEEAFITMCDEIIDEQEKMLWHEFDNFKEGLLAATFFSTDRLQHIFWVTRDSGHPLYDAGYAKKYGHVIDDVYRKMDKILGELLDNIDNETALIVFSDHGFTTFRRTVHLNSWLVQSGLMTLTQKIAKDDKDGGALFQYVDWNRTNAYSVGFGSIYLNVKGRERNGIVQNGEEAESLKDDIVNIMLSLKDPQNGNAAIRNVYKQEDIYRGGQSANSPDLVVGFHDGYRASWQTAIGGAPAEVVEDNLKKWSGDHIVDAGLVPGILLTNFKINTEEPHQMDIAPTVLSCLGMSSPDMGGKSLI